MLANQVGIYKNVEKLLQRLMRSVVCMSCARRIAAHVPVPQLLTMLRPCKNGRLCCTAGTQDQERKSWEYMPVLFAVFVPLIASTDASAYNLSLEGPGAVRWQLAQRR